MNPNISNEGIYQNGGTINAGNISAGKNAQIIHNYNAAHEEQIPQTSITESLSWKQIEVPNDSPDALLSSEGRKNFFISYNRADKHWAEWIAWTLEEAGYSVVIQSWDFRPGGNFILDMQRATENTERTIAVLSEDYLRATYTQPEWAAAFKLDPQSLKRIMIPIRVRECKPTGLLGPIAYIDLLGLSEASARDAILEAFKERAKPIQAPAFPGSRDRVTSDKVQFPGYTPTSTS
ncbi:MAG: toll/interleukin-1 receptor domain-containing protein [Chroococcidiopsidaceae cyanobacterium CP_BM_RX_35]|nr:toll/interleukin-1 receptor domain-containing protein [Chroococcidiopsidaceae cyanobacterium CP_BM_RX_35]